MLTRDEPRHLACTVDVAAPAELVWDLVSDLPGMGRFSPENTGGRWRGSDGPRVGAVLVGDNRRGARRWRTRVEVVACERPTRFAFRASSLGLPIALWTYELEPSPTGCRVTESWQDLRGPLVRHGGRLLTGVADRRSHTVASMESTLATLTAYAEAAAAS